MDIWETRSNNQQQTMISLACLVLGAVLLVALHDYGASGSNSHAGFLLGVVLLGLGLATLLAGGSQTVQVDMHKREIRVLDQRITGSKSRTIAFDEVQGIEVGCLQTRSKHALRYFLQLQLASGESYALFSPERSYPVAANPAVVAGWKTRLQAMLAAGTQVPVRTSTNSTGT